MDKERVPASRKLEIASIAIAFLGLLISAISMTTTHFVSLEQNDLYEKNERMGTYETSLICTPVLEGNDSTLIAVPQTEGADNREIRGPAIHMETQSGAIATLTEVVYFGGTTVAVKQITTPSEVKNDHDAGNLEWVLSEYSVPEIATNPTTGETYGCIYLIAQGYQGDYCTSMICFTLSPDGNSVADYRIYTELNALYAANNKEFNRAQFGDFDSNALIDYSKLLEALRGSGFVSSSFTEIQH